ncbi:MAG: radical SAM protein [Candidatus Omnitrophica bacterium CG07_land_8_20_14_0_80_42_15]|uniref:Radical SAM protein n=1 Tax=Candidatus Aquitaenariimonas noxiae TaxID=1974741 RepID=A0A2J0KVC0_9BACT|nr:MAG: radical SAM protein [Candidatus Omnitrophica bacterium CG07_land_8_20_14_0_80_42_15]
MNKQIPKLVIADTQGRIFPHPSLEGVGMEGGAFFRLSECDLIKLPYGSELFSLPDRLAACYDPQTKKNTIIEINPFSKKKERCFPVAAFISPGFTVTYNSAYVEMPKSSVLPLFSYAVVVFCKGGFYVAAIQIDKGLRHDLRHMDMRKIEQNARKFTKLFPSNRLIKHLGTCALTYGCPNAKNFFLHKYEAPLPVSPLCNARCAGCISYQPKKNCSAAQPRIKFVPKPWEIAEAALFHISNTANPIVSFGQGCEGEPLLFWDIIERSIRLIRAKTAKGLINLNTNASKPEAVGRLFDAGLDSMRASLNSAREDYYTRYYKPSRYTFGDILRSIKLAKRKNGFVSANYLTMPGFTDSEDEFTALKRFIDDYRIDMIQWRNLNFDPMEYFRILKIPANRFKTIGIRKEISLIKKHFPSLMMGYFNPSKGQIRHHS